MHCANTVTCYLFATMTSESPSPGGGRRPLFDLSGLLDDLHRLYLQVGGRLLHHRLQSSDSESAGRDVNIEGKLGRRLEDVATQAQVNAAVDEASVPAAEQDAASYRRPATRTSRGMIGGLRSKLTGGFRRSVGSQSQLHLGEKMQASTWEHINKAQRLARLGKLESARLHAGLAENAMQTASRYMGEEEYAAFKSDVEARIKSIVAD